MWSDLVLQPVLHVNHSGRPPLSIRKGALAVFSLLSGPFCRVGPAPQVGSPAGAVPVTVLEARRQRLLEALRRRSRHHLVRRAPRRVRPGLRLPGIQRLLLPDRPGGSRWVAGLERRWGSRLVLYLPPRSPGAEQWTGATLGPGEEARGLTGVDLVRSTEVPGGTWRVGLDGVGRRNGHPPSPPWATPH